MKFFDKLKFKKAQKNKEKIDKDEFTGYVDSLLEQTQHPTDDEIDERFSLDNMSMNERYSVDNAIDLLRDLPDVEPEVLATIVRKTLESAKIDVTHIISSAQSKQEKLESDIEILNQNIAGLQEQLGKNRERIRETNESLDEVRNVKALLQKSFGIVEPEIKKVSYGSNKDQNVTSLTDSGRFQVKAK